MFETTLPASEPRTTSGSDALTANSAMISSGALPKLAFRKPPIPGPGVLARVLGRLADQPRERHERGRRGDEQRRVVGVEDVPQENRDRGQHERRPEELAAHGATLASRARGRSLRLGRHADAVRVLARAGRGRSPSRARGDRPRRPAGRRRADRALPRASTSRSSGFRERSRRSSTRSSSGGCSRDFEVDVDDERAAAASSRPSTRAWDPARVLGAHTHALLESLRARGLKLGLVSNAFDPGWLLHRDLEQMGLARAARLQRLLVRGRDAQAAPGDLRAGARGARGRAGARALRRRPALRGRARRGRARDDDRAGALVPGRRAPGRRASPTTRRSRSWTS